MQQASAIPEKYPTKPHPLRKFALCWKLSGVRLASLMLSL
jgi:hypothetical protein